MTTLHRLLDLCTAEYMGWAAAAYGLARDVTWDVLRLQRPGTGRHRRPGRY